MIAAALAGRADRHPERPLLRSARSSLSFGACQQQAGRLADELRSWAGGRVALAGTTTEWLLPRLAALDALSCRLYLPPQEPSAALDEVSHRHGLDAVLAEVRGAPVTFTRPPVVAPPAAGELVLFSSGTTGTPKAVLQTWPRLARRIRTGAELEGSCWLASYAVTTFAGLQVLLHALLNGATLVVPPSDPGKAAALAREAGVTHVSGTPSFYRLLLARAADADLAALSLRQLTLGGEAAEQALLDALRARFPQARLTQIYASTEMGACFSVQDGLAGFPSEYLRGERDGVRLRIVDGELYVGSAGAMKGYLDGAPLPPGELHPTGDLVGERADRVLFVGRRGTRINVGGSKAQPEEVEAVVREVPGVLAVRVSGAASSLVGQLVRAEVVLDAGVDAAEARRLILARCRERLRPHMVPRLLEFVDELVRTGSGKLRRGRP